MGIGKGPAILLMKESLRRPFNGRLLTLGRQGVSISPYQLKHYAKLAGISLRMPIFSDPYAPMRDIDFFLLLGFSDMQSLDYSDYEGASIQFDLNSGETPEEYREAFDVIYDGGTIEHIFHLPNVLKTLVWMLKPGGRLIHLNPASNHLEHSFYMFSPTFFYDYYKCNNFDVNYVQIVRYTACHDYQYIVYDYFPGCFSGTSIGSGGLDTGMYMVHTVVTKAATSTSHVIPNQSMYAKDMWLQPKTALKGSLIRGFFKEETLRRWKQLLKQNPIYPFYARCKLGLRKHGVPLQPSDRF